MTLRDQILATYDRETGTTRRLLERIPADKLEWRPHPKSTTFNGIGRHLAGHDELPLIPSIRAVLRAQEHTHRTILSVIPDTFNIPELIRATESVVGPLIAPHTGILIVLPVLEAYGLRENERLFTD